MRRRDLLRFGSLITTAAVVPFDVLQRLAAALDRRTRVDAALLDGLAGATAAYAKGYYSRRPTTCSASYEGTSTGWRPSPTSRWRSGCAIGWPPSPPTPPRWRGT